MTLYDVGERHELAERLSRGFTAGCDNECWLWTGATAAGYGRLKYKRRLLSAHVIAVLLSGRDIPKGMVVGHTCDVKLCVNPSHLEVITYSQNMKDAFKRLPNKHKRGEQMRNATLTDDIVRCIREMRASTGAGHRRIAKALGVSVNAVRHVVYGTGWMHVQ